MRYLYPFTVHICFAESYHQISPHVILFVHLFGLTSLLLLAATFYYLNNFAIAIDTTYIFFRCFLGFLTAVNEHVLRLFFIDFFKSEFGSIEIKMDI